MTTFEKLASCYLMVIRDGADFCLSLPVQTRLRGPRPAFGTIYASSPPVITPRAHTDTRDGGGKRAELPASDAR